MKKERKKRLARLAERKDRRHAAKMTATVPGILKMTASGYGFVVPRKGEAATAPIRAIWRSCRWRSPTRSVPAPSAPCC